jgi:protocatechuate 3,4-dioxygenase beta subunit
LFMFIKYCKTTMIRILFIVCLAPCFSVLTSCNGQQHYTTQNSVTTSGRVGGDCEVGYCDLMYLGMPETINAVDTSAGWFEKGQKLLVTGTVFQLDGKTPAPDVIIYYHHTDDNGYYSPGDGKPENRTRHGHIRGWVKSDAQGKYSIYTIRPAPYPNEVLPAHIHWLVKEPDISNEYWTDDLVFADDRLLAPALKNHPAENRAGSGIVRVTTNGDVQIAEHNFILGLNIPDYPKK